MLQGYKWHRCIKICCYYTSMRTGGQPLSALIFCSSPPAHLDHLQLPQAVGASKMPLSHGLMLAGGQLPPSCCCCCCCVIHVQLLSVVYEALIVCLLHVLQPITHSWNATKQYCVALPYYHILWGLDQYNSTLIHTIITAASCPTTLIICNSRN